MKALGIKKIPYCPCPLPTKKGRSSILFCASECLVLCSSFIGFKYILSRCVDPECSRHTPCQECLEKIRSHKTFYKIIQIAQLHKNSDILVYDTRARIYIDRRNNLGKTE